MATFYNGSYVEYDGHLFNETLLNEYNYTIYGNGTLSNSTGNCYLIYGPFNVVFLPNGTAINGTACSTPTKKIRTRGGVGIAFGAIFAILIVLGITALAKHGKSYLPVEKNFRLVSRRWPWYWFFVAGACGCISGLVSIDVDRDYLQGTALILQNVFYYVTLPAMLASVWEMTRHWGSLCQRRLADRDPWIFVNDETRERIEFYIPLVFYLFGFLTFFLSVLRSWTIISNGTWPLTWDAAIVAATDGRFKASSIMAALAWLTIVTSAFITLRFYPSVAHPIPPKVPICISLMLVRVAYNIAVAWEYNIGPLRPSTNPAWIYALGYAPVALAMAVMVVSARFEENEDKLIIAERRQREREADRELAAALPMKVVGSGASEGALKNRQ
ncbi:hypothetical protein FN846DRAFT_945951 [Sphaerosporella brunnea]|uniref:Uncharacterized protein n=1 Tax=Sphaerosporella brunnea TaxID=1250544 RepID=A0A5J5EYX7_9PEZI|nr:hypothetical protein FN846DRAFT_945951 [Sphaerosporella brunnea]